jgi:protein XRP2
MSTEPAKKPKLNKADFQFISRTGETLMKKPGDINGIQFKIKDLKDCTVYILDHTAQVSFIFSFDYDL